MDVLINDLASQRIPRKGAAWRTKQVVTEDIAQLVSQEQVEEPLLKSFLKGP